MTAENGRNANLTLNGLRVVLGWINLPRRPDPPFERTNFDRPNPPAKRSAMDLSVEIDGAIDVNEAPAEEERATLAHDVENSHVILEQVDSSTRPDPPVGVDNYPKITDYFSRVPASLNRGKKLSKSYNCKEVQTLVIPEAKSITEPHMKQERTVNLTSGTLAEPASGGNAINRPVGEDGISAEVRKKERESTLLGHPSFVSAAGDLSGVPFGTGYLSGVPFSASARGDQCSVPLGNPHWDLSLVSRKRDLENGDLEDVAPEWPHWDLSLCSRKRDLEGVVGDELKVAAPQEEGVDASTQLPSGDTRPASPRPLSRPPSLPTPLYSPVTASRSARLRKPSLPQGV